MTKERDLLTEKTKELKRLLCLSNQSENSIIQFKKIKLYHRNILSVLFNLLLITNSHLQEKSDCCSCYLLSERSASWDEARKDCRDRGADLVVIDSPEDQTALTNIATTEAWIGLNDREQEGTWKWVDGTPLSLMEVFSLVQCGGKWGKNQPDSGGGISYLGEEDCVHVKTDTKKSWNDLSCSASFKWICEKTP
uniref:C-type lectin domain-containing protein n=1 Tax=Oreochromis aureus TaxID=47969 RepID=A0A668TZZ6_OREAU